MFQEELQLLFGPHRHARERFNLFHQFISCVLVSHQIRCTGTKRCKSPFSIHIISSSFTIVSINYYFPLFVQSYPEMQLKKVDGVAYS